MTTVEDTAVQAAAKWVKSPQEFLAMPDEYQELGKRLMKVHAEIKITGADDYTRLFYPLAPTAYEKHVCCQRAAEELNHFQLVEQVLAAIGVDITYMVSQDMSERLLFPTDLLREVSNWMERGIFSFLGEAVILDHMVEYAESSYQPFAVLFKETIVQDEQTHVAHGYRIIKEACSTDAGRAEVQTALDRFWPVVLDLFGNSTSRHSADYVRWGFRKTTNSELRDKFVKKTRPRLIALGLNAPDDFVGRKYV